MKPYIVAHEHTGENAGVVSALGKDGQVWDLPDLTDVNFEARFRFLPCAYTAARIITRLEGCPFRPYALREQTS